MDQSPQDNFRALLTEAIIKLCQMEAVYSSELQIEGTVCVVSDRASVVVAHFTECVGSTPSLPSLDSEMSYNPEYDQHANDVSHSELMLPEVKVEHVLPDEIIKTFEEVGYSDSLSVMHGFCQEAEMNANHSNRADDVKKSSGGQYQCPNCHKMCKSKCTLQRHMKKHCKHQLHRCHHCSASFTSLAKLHMHITSNHSNWCDSQLSGRELADMSRMQYNKEHHHDVVFQTEQMNNVEHNSCLDTNMCIADNGESTQSQLEAGSSDSLALLEAHERNECEKTLDESDMMTNDRNQLSESHLTTTPKTESKYCNAGKSSIMQYFEKVHVETPQGLYQYKCCLCHKMFKIRSSLYEHINSHIGKRRYTCAQCGDQFVHHSSLHNHINNKHVLVSQQSRMRYLCTGCDRGFKFRSQFQRHLRSNPNHSTKALDEQ